MLTPPALQTMSLSFFAGDMRLHISLYAFPPTMLISIARLVLSSIFYSLESIVSSE